MAARRLRDGEELAELEPQEGSLWHAFRRGVATARKYLPALGVAAPGSWKETTSLQRAYQQADQDMMLEVEIGAGELSERQA